MSVVIGWPKETSLIFLWKKTDWNGSFVLVPVLLPVVYGKSDKWDLSRGVTLWKPGRLLMCYITPEYGPWDDIHGVYVIESSKSGTEILNLCWNTGEMSPVDWTGVSIDQSPL